MATIEYRQMTPGLVTVYVSLPGPWVSPMNSTEDGLVVFFIESFHQSDLWIIDVSGYCSSSILYLLSTILDYKASILKLLFAHCLHANIILGIYVTYVPMFFYKI